MVAGRLGLLAAAGGGEELQGEVLTAPEQGDLGEGQLMLLAASETLGLQVTASHEWGWLPATLDMSWLQVLVKDSRERS